jgi:hypothetical protein
MSSCDQANRGEKLALVWRNRKKTSQIINDYLYWDQANRGINLVWFGEIEGKLGKLPTTTFAYRSSS